MLIMTRFKTFLQGVVMGIAEVIPGVSGSTLALIMNIYDDFIDFLHSISVFIKSCIKFIFRQSKSKQVIEDFKNIQLNFGVPLLLGMCLSFAAFASVISYLFDEYPSYILAFFFGLVIASVAIPLNRMKQKGILELGIALISFGSFFYLFGLNPLEFSNDPNLVFVFFSGMLAMSAMVLPGVSGSFILLLLGLYQYTIDSVKLLLEFNISTERLIRLVLIGLGVLSGFIIFIKFVKILLKNYESQLMALLIGLMLASARILWPFIDTTEKFEDVNDYPKIFPWDENTLELILVFLLVLIAVVSVYALNKFSRSK